MTFPNAYNGITKVFVAQILQIIGEACMIFGIGSGSLILFSQTTGGAITYGVLTMVFIAAGFVLPLIALIINLIGLHTGGKDDDSIQSAFVLSVFVLIIEAVSVILSIIFRSSQTISGNVSDVISNICEVIVMILVINGVCSLAEKLGKDKIIDSGRHIMTMVIIMYAISILSRLIMLLFGRSGAGNVIAFILQIAAGVFSIICYILYLVFLGKGKNMLRDN